MTFQVRDFEQHAHDNEDRPPYFTAMVVAGDERVEVHSRFGAWYGVNPEGGLLVLARAVEFKLVEKGRPIVKAWRRAREAARSPQPAEGRSARRVGIALKSTATGSGTP